MEPDGVSNKTVLSAVFQRVPSITATDDMKNAGLIRSHEAPREDVIIVHSECLPEILMFCSEVLPSATGSQKTGSLAPSASPGQDNEDWDEDAEGVPGVVTFHKLPLFKDVPCHRSNAELPSVVDLKTVTCEAVSTIRNRVPPTENVSGSQSDQVLYSATSERVSGGRMRTLTSGLQGLSLESPSAVEKTPCGNVPHKASAFAEPPQSTLSVKQTRLVLPEWSGRNMTTKAQFKPGVYTAHKVSLVKTPIKDESLGRTTETSEKHTSPRVAPQMSPKAGTFHVPETTVSGLGCASSVSNAKHSGLSSPARVISGETISQTVSSHDTSSLPPFVDHIVLAETTDRMPITGVLNKASSNVAALRAKRLSSFCSSFGPVPSVKDPDEDVEFDVITASSENAISEYTQDNSVRYRDDSKLQSGQVSHGTINGDVCICW
ncbi:hypothetical protein DPEC_G00065240 [Dallia pectoralis]|uniref:Uncharacterized protein n=1 Tax=Dallia pectoralis TaxID=75939 RepID=A0ACC2H864_DALPE|nr:hypothetical protein DPEC_G00065240 [Dallia pectoralis]